VLALHDSDPFDYAKAERVFPSSGKKQIEFTLTPAQNNHGCLEIELVNAKGTPTLRIILDSTGTILTKQGYRNKSLGKYAANQKLNVKITVDTKTRFYTVAINDSKPSNNICFAPVDAVERIVFRTGVTRRFPDADTPTDQDYDLLNADIKVKDAAYYIQEIKTQKP